MGLSVSPGELKTETVEEFISISDGQVRGGGGWRGARRDGRTRRGGGGQEQQQLPVWCSRCGRTGLQE